MKYSHIIDFMTWSYSRLTSYEFCQYGWLLHYIFGVNGERPLFFSTYGNFVHDILADVLSERVSRKDALLNYLTGFGAVVPKSAPSTKVFSNYFNDGVRYISNLSGLPDSNIAGVEEEFEIKIEGVPFTGRIDLIVKDKNGVELWDHKSHVLRPASGKKKQTKSDVKLNEYLRQLYLYGEYVKERYGEFPASLVFNCFRVGSIIKNPFDEGRVQGTKEWFANTIESISNTEDWRPSIDYFKCKYLCDVHDECEYYQMGR